MEPLNRTRRLEKIFKGINLPPKENIIDSQQFFIVQAIILES